MRSTSIKGDFNGDIASHLYPLVSSNCTLWFVSDVNECEESPCAQEAVCTNSNGSYVCACNQGFMGDGYSCESEHFVLHLFLLLSSVLAAELRY